MTSSRYNISGISNRNSQVLSRQRARTSTEGVACENLREPIPTYNEAPCENVVKGRNNSYIVLGRDRPGSRASGFGGAGETQASMIDLVVGRMGSNPREVDEDGEVIMVDPNFNIDSARIYISQKTNIDDNFFLADGTIGKSRVRSGIGIKADSVRIIGREGIKLVTRTDELNSQGEPVDFVKGIDLIAGNDDSDLQPLVKGGNVKEALERIVNHIDNLNGIVHRLMVVQAEFNSTLANHWHVSPFYGQPTQPSVPAQNAGASAISNLLGGVQTSLMSHKSNLVNFETKYLSQSGDKYINSRYNNVN